MRIHKSLMASVAATILLGIPAAPVLAQDKAERIDLAREFDGVNYFHKPGADIEAHDAAILHCVRRALSGMLPPRGLPRRDADTPLMLVLGPPMRSAIENCMVFGGWRVVRLEGAQADRARKLEGADLRAQLSAWVGADMPPGRTIWSWNNDAMFGTTIRNNSTTLTPPGRMLGLNGLGSELLHKPIGEVLGGDTRGAEPVSLARQGKASRLGAVPDGQAVILVRVRGTLMAGGQTVTFDRLASSPGEPGKATGINAFGGSPLGSGEYETMAFVVAPGRWRWSGFGMGPGSLDLCLAAPAFDVAPGEVVYAGAFDLKADVLDIDLSLDGPKGDLGAWPGAGKLRAARYVNGVEGPCRQRNIFAAEIPGAPLAEGGKRPG